MTLIQEACKYAQKGWKIFPLIPGTKAPIHSGGFHNATDDLEQIIEWWTQTPNANIGVATGSMSDIWVLDIDVKKQNGVTSIKQLIEKYGTPEKTLIQKTASGGWHYIYKNQSGLGSTAARLPGIDVRADGGYIVVAPSILAEIKDKHDAGSYHWVNDLEPVNIPKWLIEEIYTTKKTKITLEEGSRNNDMFKIASSLRGRGLSPDQIFAVLTVENLKCAKPLPEKEVRAIAGSAGKRYEPEPNSLDTFAANGRSPGQIALEMLYSDDIYISVADELYKYTDGYYQPLDQNTELMKISDLFDRCITNAHSNSKVSQFGFARTQHAKEAFSHVKSKFYISHELTKCKGLNLKNGVVKPRYLPNGEVEFDLHPHSPDDYFLFQADFEYKPELDNTEINRLLDNMLDPEAQSALLRNIASVIDMKTIRSKHSRVLKALILAGEGSNGKDSIRTWCQLLLGKTAFSNISVQVFKRADSAREFQINSLANSRINWCSENSKVAMDNCQMIKQIITGDPIILEQKHKEPFTIEPEIVMIFNANKVPAFESLSEAMQSRYAIIPFPYVFKDNPDPLKTYERKADSRLKYNPEFLKGYVLPAFLNKLLVEFKLLVKDGISYTFQEAAMDQIRKDNNHVYEFVEDLNIVECEPKDGLTSGDIFELYCKWIVKEGYATTGNFNDIIKYNHPHDQYDRILTSKKQLTNKLKEIFPRLGQDRTKNKRTLSLRVENDPF